MSGDIQAPKGTFDYLPPEAERRARIEAALLDVAHRAGYERAETPIFEDTALFARGVGASTDVVLKEMYSFADKGGRSLTLRPEGTAGILRALIEHGQISAGLSKLSYSGANFRYERPQAGRQRQFWQVGIEAIGSADPVLDAEVIVVGDDALAAVGAERTLLVTSLGDDECRPPYRERLRDYLRGLGGALPAEVRERAEQNPLRVLDHKDPHVQEVTADAPLLRDYLCAACKAHHEVVLGLLADAGVSWSPAPRLVRGLDYYMRTTFEWQAPMLESSQNALGGGGRYDGLSELIGGPPAPGIGWALGFDRLMLALERSGAPTAARAALDVYVIPVVAAARGPAFALVSDLRRAGMVADMPFAERSLKGHMKSAAKTGARVAVLLGERELAAGVAAVRSMDTASQAEVPLDQARHEIARLLVETPDEGPQ